MKQIKVSLVALIAVIGVATAVPVLTPHTAFAQEADTSNDSNSSGGASSGGSATTNILKGVNDVGGSDNTVSLKDRINTITNILLFVLGAIAVIVIIIGGIRYATSNGDSSQTKAAKDTILYAVVGLVVAIIAYAIVQFILTAFKVK